ncbi:uncharacterized protein LOC144742631 [Ciona intestinalis]
MQRRSDYSYIELSPAEIRFLQDSIGPYFRSGGSVNECIYDILKGRSDINTFPKIRIVKHGNLFWSLDNRRLYIFRVLEERGHIRTITARLLPEFRFDEDKFTSKNNGVSIYLRGGHKTLSHSKNVGRLKLTAREHYHYSDYGGEDEYDHDDEDGECSYEVKQTNYAIQRMQQQIAERQRRQDWVSAASTKQVSNTPITRNPTRNINKHVATYVPRTTENSPLLPARERNEQDCCCCVIL